MKTALIVAVAENGVIGKNNQLLWHLPADLKRFKKLTMGKPMIMGRKTFESIGKPLPGRVSIIITHNRAFQATGVLTASSLEEALEIAAGTGTDETFVIGGGEIYRLALPCADTIYLTKVHATPVGDTFFEWPDPACWQETARERFEPDEKHAFAYEFIDFKRKPNG